MPAPHDESASEPSCATQAIDRAPRAEVIPATPELDAVKDELGTTHAQIETLEQNAADNLRTSVELAIKAGHLLRNAKRIVGHGKFQRWVQVNVKFSARTARIYMRLADHEAEVGQIIAEAKRQPAAVLTIRRVLTLLAKPDRSARTASRPRKPRPAPDGAGGDARAQADETAAHEAVAYVFRTGASEVVSIEPPRERLAPMFRAFHKHTSRRSGEYSQRSACPVSWMDTPEEMYETRFTRRVVYALENRVFFPPVPAAMVMRTPAPVRNDGLPALLANPTPSCTGGRSSKRPSTCASRSDALDWLIAVLMGSEEHSGLCKRFDHRFRADLTCLHGGHHRACRSATRSLR